MGLGHVRGLYWLQHVGSICSYCGGAGWTTLMRRVETQIKRGDQRRSCSVTRAASPVRQNTVEQVVRQNIVEQVGNTKVLQNRKASGCATVGTEGRGE